MVIKVRVDLDVLKKFVDLNLWSSSQATSSMHYEATVVYANMATGVSAIIDSSGEMHA